MNSIKLMHGDALDVLKTLPSNSVQTCVTSPPYWGLRSYNCDGQIGQEETLAQFIGRLVDVFREVKRVLHPSGMIWVNMGDSTNSAMTRGAYGDQSLHGYEVHGVKRQRVTGLHAKNLIGQPWRLAFALQDDGWILRRDIIWFKTNAMPSSVEDVPTPAHEYIFLLSKSPKYFYDQMAIREPCVSEHGSGNGFASESRLSFQNADGTPRGNDEQWQVTDTRNKRDVWVIPTEPFPDAHFATFPTAIPDICIKAGTSEKGCCPKCLAPWVRIKEKGEVTNHGGYRKRADAPGAEVSPKSVFRTGTIQTYRTIGWAPSCKCPEHEPQPCRVLDCFSGAGTTGLVASRLFRSYVGIELNPEYLEMSRNRIQNDQPLFNSVEILM